MTMTSEERDRFKKELDSLWDSSEKPVPKSPAITRAAIENLTAPLGQTEERADAIPDPFAGTFADMFALADSPGQREILKKLIQERQQEDPEGFSKLFSGSRATDKGYLFGWPPEAVFQSDPLLPQVQKRILG